MPPADDQAAAMPGTSKREPKTGAATPEEALRERSAARALAAGFPPDWPHALLDQLPDAIMAFDLTGRLVYANPVAITLLGYTSIDEVQQATVAGLAQRFHVRDATGQPVALRPLDSDPAYAGAATPERMLRYRHPVTGEDRTAVTFATPIRNSEGRVVGRLTHSWDTTATARTSEALQLLAEAGILLGSSMEDEEALRRVARLVVPRLADWCVIDMLDPAGAIRRVAIEHVDPAKRARLLAMEQKYPIGWDSASPVIEVLRTGRSILLADIPEEEWNTIGLGDADLASVRELGFYSLMFVPLIARGDVLGAITLAAAEARRTFGAEDLRLAEDLGRRAALAIDRARLSASEQAQRREAERAAQRADRLLGVTAALSEALTPAQVAEVVVSQGVAAVRACCGVVARLGADGDTLELMRAAGLPPALVTHWARVPINAPQPLAAAVRHQDTLVIEAADGAARDYPEVHAAAAAEGWNSFAAVPLCANGRVLGAIGFAFSGDRQITAAKREFLSVLARLCAQAFERARLYDAQHAARSQAEEARRRLTLLSRASAVLGSSLDSDAVLQTLSDLVVEDLASGCIVHQIDAQERLVAVAVAHRDAKLAARVRSLLADAPIPIAAASELTDVVKRGEALVWSAPAKERFETMIPGPAWRDVARSLAPTAVLAVPLVVHGRTLGMITLLESTPGKAFSSQDLPLVRALAHRAAAAIDNAQVYRRSRAQTMRMSVIAEVSRALTEARLDLPTVMETVARRVAELVGDHCVVSLLSDDRKALGLIANYHTDPARRQAVADLLASAPSSDGFGLTRVVVTTGEPLLIDDLERDERLTPEARAQVSAVGIGSIMAVPLRVGGTVIGTLDFARDAGNAAYTDDDLALLLDLADRAAMTIESARLYRAAQDAIRARDEFLSIASHELKTPLTTVKAYVQLLDREVRSGDPDHGRLVGLTDHLQGQVWRLEMLVADLLDASRIQQGRLELRRERVDLVELAREALARVDGAPERTPAHRLSLVQNGPVVGDWDPARLDQVLTNLLSNALKYSPNGGEVCVRVVQDGDHAVLTVSDEGIGISPADRARLYEPFSRGDLAHLRASGTGLGLFISARIVERHDGTIDVESEVGRGTTFTVRLPQASVE